MIILAGAEKGGCGKSTLATNVAAMLASAGRDVLLLDTDTSGDAAGWAAQRRNQAEVPVVHCVQAFGQVADNVRDAAGRYQDVVIDAGGRDSVELRSAMTVADVMLVPSCPSQWDLWQIEKVAGLVDQARGFNPSLRAVALINRASTNWTSSEGTEARQLLADFPQFEVAEVVLHDRKAYRTAAGTGHAVFELPGGQKAADELWALFEEVMGGVHEAAAGAAQ